jgi:multicomponent Na+:H+ antiporter subunit B
MEQAVDIILLLFLAVTAVAVVRLRSLFAVVMLFGIYSLLSASIFVVLDAVDVAFTEAAVGAGISTVLMLGTLALTDREEKTPARVSPLPLLVVLVTGAALVFGTLDMPHFGAADAPGQRHVAPQYLEYDVRQYDARLATEIHIPNVVTTVLASYRGYDTLGEVTVIFTAGIGVLLLLGVARGPARPRRRKRKGEQP